MPIIGNATREGTRRRMSHFAGLAARELGTTGWTVSQAGFGGYRVDDRVGAHRQALTHALRSGINLVDTSSNYTDGHSERLIGSVLRELIEAGELAREEVVVVSKAGYIQGLNYELAEERQAAGRPFPEVVKLQEGLWHCLHPEFLENQLARSLERLQLESLDVLLLHNPEYFLKAHGDRAEYDRRIQAAFRFLEAQVERGAIACYGVSSNTFPESASSSEFTCLERLLELAAAMRSDHHFRVIQFPANLVETGFVLEPNQSGGRSLLALAEEADLGVLINRPLNAFTGQAMVRLADFPPGQPLAAGALGDALAHVSETEQMLLSSQPDSPQLQQCLVIGPMLQANLPHIQGVEHWQEVVAYHLLPRVEGSLQLLGKHPAIEPYREEVMQLFRQLNGHFFAEAHRRSQRWHDRLRPLLPDEAQGLGLSQKAVLLLRSLEGVDCVLVGMRTPAYVDDVVAGLGSPRLGDARRVWQALAGSLV